MHTRACSGEQPRWFNHSASAACPLASLANTWFLTLPRSSSSATSSLLLATSMPTQRPVLPFIASDLPRMRAWQPSHTSTAADPSYRSVLLSEETVGSTYLTHGLGVASGPRPHRHHPDRPGQHPLLYRLLSWHWK